jgi:alpha-L-arabinofuranosidase
LTLTSSHISLAIVLLGIGTGSAAAQRSVPQIKNAGFQSKLEAVDPATAPLLVTRRFLTQDRINPFQYGQFMEYLCTLFPGMWSEKLDDGSFEGLTPYKVAYLKETDFNEQPWYPAGATNRAVLTRDASTAVSGETSLQIRAGAGPTCTVGVAQSGIAIESGLACNFTCYLKAAGLVGPVTVRLHRDGTTYASADFHPGPTWSKFRARLVSLASDVNATLTMEFRGPATLWLDNASLMPEDAVAGWRKDVVTAVKALRPGIIRFGGSALDDPKLGDFEWKDTIGDPDRRRPFRAWGGLQPAGAGLEEFVQFCRLVGAEPLFCVRVTRREPQDAADQVQYFNGAVQTPMGALRAKNGHPEPYAVRFWQVGNEQRGPVYEDRLRAFCAAMKRADPSIQLLASYPTPGVLERAGDLLDFVSPHHYDCANLAGVAADLSSIRGLVDRKVPGRPIKVAVTEWNTTGGDWGPTRARLWTLENALACARYHNLLHRHCDQVALACRSNLTNSFCSGCIQTDRHRLYKTPVYYAQQLYATLAGDRPLEIDSSLPPSAEPDVSATLSPRGEFVILTAVNDTSHPISRPLDFSAYAEAGQRELPPVEVWTLADTRNAGEPDAFNSFAEPERVAPRPGRFVPRSPRFDYRFPALSLTVLWWSVRNP